MEWVRLVCTIFMVGNETYAMLAAPKMPNLSASSDFGGGCGGLMKACQLRWRKPKKDDMIVVYECCPWDYH
jgi:hypothetical protein